MATVVEWFKRLTAEEQIAAYLQIEEIWKALQDRPGTSGRADKSLLGLALRRNSN